MTIQITTKDIFHAVNILLLVAILGLLLWSQPWKSTTSEVRKITVSGEATLEAEPDEYVFNPYFEVKDTNQETAKAKVSKLANDAVDAIKKLGVEEKDIKLDASSYDRWYWDADNEEGVLNAYLTVKVKDKDLAQKVQDYLTSSEAKGQLTSQESFSEEKQKNLEAEATEKAIEDAKSKAEAQAKLVGAKLGKVIEVQQDNPIAFPYQGRGDAITLEASDTSLPVLPGEQEFTKIVVVIYELR